MYSRAELDLSYKFGNARILDFPYPHLFIEDVFPKDYYDELQANIPDPSVMVPLEQARTIRGHKQRFVLDLKDEKHLSTLSGFWSEFSNWLCSGRFASIAIQKFRPYLQQHFKNRSKFYNEALLVEDITKYSLGPHTDSMSKVITMLFYLPKDTSQAHLGTSIYVPRNPEFRCPGGPQHKFEDFARVRTMPFLPNSLFVFLKTDNSFHGVEPVTDPDTKRWLLLFDIYHAV